MQVSWNIHTGTQKGKNRKKNHMTCLKIIKNSLLIYRVTKKKTNNSVECEFVKKIAVVVLLLSKKS